MTVRVRLFAVLREWAGSESVEIELAEGATVADALAELSRVSLLAEGLDRMPVRMAVNRVYASSETRLAPGDELALIPPISGGADVHARVTEEPLSLEALTTAVSRPAAGAVVAFQGVTREVARLDY
jgi:MoaE-MoaD fusion protein